MALISRRRFLVGGFVAVASSVVAGYLRLNAGSSNVTTDNIRPEPTAVPNEIGELTPASAGPDPAFAPQRMESSAFFRRGFGSGEEITLDHGIFALDSSTGEVQSWQLDPLLEVSPIEYRMLDEQYILATTRGKQTWIEDIQGGTFEWSNSELVLIAVSNGRLLMRQEALASSESSTVYSLFEPSASPGQGELPEVVRFSLSVDENDESNPRPVLVSADGRYVLVAPSGFGGAVQILALPSGVPHTVLSVPANARISDFSARESGIQFVMKRFNETGNQVTAVAVYRVDWAGTDQATLVSEVPTPGAIVSRLSPDMTLLAVQSIGGPPVQTPLDPHVPFVTVYDMTSAQPVAQVRSAAFVGQAILDTGFPVWLSDSSGLVLATVLEEGAVETTGSFRFLLMDELTLVPIPGPPDGSPASGIRPMWPAPSASDSRLISFGGPIVYDTETSRWVWARLESVAIDAFVAFPGATSYFRKNLATVFDFGAGFDYVMLEPKVLNMQIIGAESAASLVSVKPVDGASCTWLHEKPSNDSPQVACVAPSAPLELVAVVHKAEDWIKVVAQSDSSVRGWLPSRRVNHVEVS